MAELLLFLIAVWALGYAFTIENRRRSEAAAARARHEALEHQVAALAHKFDDIEKRTLSTESTGRAASATAATIAESKLEPAKATAQTCTRCGSPLAPDAQYCTRCGSGVPIPVKPSEPAIKILTDAEAVHTGPRPPVLITRPPAPSVDKPAPAAPAEAKAAEPLAVKPAQPVPPPPLPPKPMAPGPAASKIPASTTPTLQNPAGSPAGTPPRPAAAPALTNVPEPHAARVVTSAPSVAAAARIATQPPKPPKKPSRSFEEVVGFRLLPIIGITAVVLGVGFMVGTQWAKFHPWLRVLILYLGGGLLLFGGISMERRRRYRILGRAILGGGWAVLVLVTYALANTESLHLLDSKNVDLFLVLGVLGAMVRHTLRYSSQIVTGVGFLLAFTAVSMNPVPPYNLIAAAMVIAGMTVIVLRHSWFELEIAGILASCANHFWWLYRVYEQQGQRAMFPHHSASVGLVIGYWLIFRTSYLVRRISGSYQESLSIAAGILNPILFLLVMKYQGFHPEWAWKLLFAMGAVEFTLGQIPVSRARRAPFKVLSTLGVALMVASPLIRGSGNALEIIWLAGAEAFLVAGILTRERLFRTFAIVISFLTALYALSMRLLPLVQQISDGKPHHNGQISLVLAVIAACFYGNTHITRRRWPELFDKDIELLSLTWLSFIASGFAVGASYGYFDDKAVAVILALLVVALSGCGKLFSISELVYQAHGIAALAFIQVLAADRDLTTLWLRVPQRVLAFAAVSAMFYLSSRFVRLSETAYKTIFYAAYAWSASSLLAVLVWYQAADWAVAVGWVALAAALTFAGQALARSDFKWQACALVLLAFVRALAVNFDLTTTFHQFTYRVISISLVAGGVYLLARWAPIPRIRPVYTAVATALLTYLIFKEAPTAWTAVLWIALAVLLTAAAIGFRQIDLRWQAFALILIAAARTFAVNFDVAGTFHGISYRLISVAATALGIYLLARWAPMPQIRPLYSVAGTLLLSVLSYREAPAPWTAVAWSGLALVLSLAARRWKDRPLLWQTHLLSALAVGWTLYANFEAPYRQTRVQLITVGLTALALYSLTWLSKIPAVLEDERIAQGYAWAGSLLVSWLAWYQLDPANVSLAWGVFALLLFEFQDFAKAWKRVLSDWDAASWRMQSYLALAGSFAHIFYANFNVSGWGAAAYSVLPLVLIYYYIYWQLDRRQPAAWEQTLRVGPLLGCLGTAALASLARFELQPNDVAIGYAVLVITPLLVAWLARRRLFAFQALAMLAMAAFRVAMYNFYHLNDSFASSQTTSFAAIVLLACAVPIAFQVRKLELPANVHPWVAVVLRHPEQPMFFVPVVLMGVLLFIKFYGFAITLAWFGEGFVVFVLALMAKERSFRLTGLGLVLICVCKLVYDTFRLENPQIRYLTWIGGGIVILIVAFLYGRNREALKDYL